MATVGERYLSSAGNTWEVVEVRGDRVRVRGVGCTLCPGCLTGETHWWAASCLAHPTMRRLA